MEFLLFGMFLLQVWQSTCMTVSGSLTARFSLSHCHTHHGHVSRVKIFNTHAPALATTRMLAHILTAPHKPCLFSTSCTVHSFSLCSPTPLLYNATLGHPHLQNHCIRRLPGTDEKMPCGQEDNVVPIYSWWNSRTLNMRPQHHAPTYTMRAQQTRALKQQTHPHPLMRQTHPLIQQTHPLMQTHSASIL